MGAVKSIKADVIVVGAGIAGLALSALIARSGGRVCLLDKRLPKFVHKENMVIGEPSQAWVSALARPAVRLLDKLGVWQWLMAHNAAPFEGMQVATEGGADFNFRGQDIGAKNLGYIVNNILIQQSLWGCVEESGEDFLAIEDQPSHWDDINGVLKTVGGAWVHAPVLVGADGANSWVRQAAGITLDVDQGVNDEAWIGMLSHQRLHEDVARQVFYHDGVVGILPSRDPRKSACVWSRSRKKEGVASSEMSDEDSDQLKKRLATFQKEGYAYSIEGEWRKRQIYSQRARTYHKGRAVLIGDAAVCVHPLAGQGLNMGLRQATQLANWLEKAHRTNGLEDMEYSFRRYAHACEGFDALSQQVYRLCRQYMGRQGVERQLLGVGMRVLDCSNRLKQRLIEHALEGDMIAH